jgi:polyphosphate kinase
MPGVKGWSENIEVISIVDRFLEHARIYLFANAGQEELYIASADWMTRNLDRRVEVAVPIYNPDLFNELITILNIQWADHVKARVLNAEGNNSYRVSQGTDAPRHAQLDIYHYLQKQIGNPTLSKIAISKAL